MTSRANAEAAIAAYNRNKNREAVEKGVRMHEDLELALEAAQLREQYGHWEEHPEYPIAQWMEDVRNCDTRLGYWEWIANAQRVPELFK